MSFFSKQSETQPTGSTRRFLRPFLLVVAILGGAYLYFFKSNVSDDLKDEYLKIPTNSTLQSLTNQLVTEGIIMDESNFKTWASWLSYDNVRAGRFKIKAGWSSFNLIRLLQRGEQAPVKIVLNNERTPEQVAGKVSKVLEHDSAAFIETFNDTTYLNSLGISRPTLMCIFLPNTYEFYWNTDPKKFLERMSKEYKKFWNPERTAKAAEQGMTPEQAVTMASIVDGESTRKDEIRKVARAYINRLKQGMKLQADPTVQFALMEIEKTPSFRRLRNSDYLTPHPYNTYVHEGLPPGPVCMPSPASIDAVLNPDNHNYVFFVAKPDNSGYHNYAETYEQHLVNVKTYTTWLNSQNK
ncbi:MAG: endolytic transglycosylase MltG [Saprospiraceae bacterium]|nr:endolytic transglycosylase MltG [Saprospiraceae bacterium]